MLRQITIILLAGWSLGCATGSRAAAPVPAVTPLACPSTVSAPWLEGYLTSLSGCKYYDWYAVGHQDREQFKLPAQLDRATLEELEFEISDPLPPRENRKYYLGHTTLPDLASNLRVLSNKLQHDKLDAVPTQDLLQAATTVLKRKNAQGECYQIQWTCLTPERLTPGSRQVIQESVHLASAQQKEIDALFQGPRASPAALKPSFMAGKRLTEPEAQELRAIRIASGLFEKDTPLSEDLVKGFDTNLTEDAFDSHQLNCSNETETIRQFMVTLTRRGLLKYFEIHGEADRDYLVFGDHSALVLINQRTREEFVLDSWFEAGGKPAHILTKADWLDKQEDTDVVDINP